MTSEFSLASSLRESEQLIEQARRMQAETAELQETAESDDGLITATVGAGGRLVSLTIDPRVYRTPDSAALAKTISDTVSAAQQQIDRASQQAAERLLAGARSDSAFGTALGQLGRRAEEGSWRT